MPNRTVLLIEENPLSAQIMTAWLRDEGVTTLSAQTISEAITLIEKKMAIFDLVIIGACLESRFPDTPPLIKLIRAQGFTGLIIANPVISSDSAVLRETGATHENDGDIIELVLQLLGKT